MILLAADPQIERGKKNSLVPEVALLPDSLWEGRKGQERSSRGTALAHNEGLSADRICPSPCCPGLAHPDGTRGLTTSPPPVGQLSRLEARLALEAAVEARFPRLCVKKPIIQGNPLGVWHCTARGCRGTRGCFPVSVGLGSHLSSTPF